MSFRHIVLLSFADATGEQRQAIADGLRALPDQIPEIRRYEVGVDLGLAAGNAHLAVVADFDDQAGYEAYRDHPAHRSLITEQIQPILTARTAIQHQQPD